MNPLHGIAKLGQSVWFDNIHKGMISSGELTSMIKEDDLKGVTSNPSIFEKAIAGNHDYDQAIEAFLADNPSADSRQLFYHLAIDDIQRAADLLMPVYQSHCGHDGFVSLEVSPDLAHDTQATVQEAIELWKRVNRPNLMIKVPATAAGVPVVERLTSEGINVNATLLFSVSRYTEVAQAYITGLEARLRRGLAVDNIASVASFFVSRVDTAVEKALADNTSCESGILVGKIAIANAKLAYEQYHKIYSLSDFQSLAAAGAKPQRLLWASTGTKSKTLSDILYLEELIGPDTVTTVPPATYQAYKDHGKPRATLEQGLEEAKAQLEQLKTWGIDLDELTDQLEKEGVASFAGSFSTLLSAIEHKMHRVLQEDHATT